MLFPSSSAAETIAYHGTLIVSVSLLLHSTSHQRPHHPLLLSQQSYRLIPLALLLSSLPKLTLLLLLSIYPSSPLSPSHVPSISFLPSSLLAYYPTLATELSSREWIIEHVLGGIGAGFGLRILMEGYGSSMASSGLILVGWAVKGVVSGWIDRWNRGAMV